MDYDAANGPNQLYHDLWPYHAGSNDAASLLLLDSWLRGRDPM